MPAIVLRAPQTFERAFDGIRAELDVPPAFPADVLAEAEKAEIADVERYDARHLRLVAIDPPGATDLDQAFTAIRLGDGYRVHYAIADIGAFIEPGGRLDEEARNRGVTLYSPDLRTPLHPPVLSEDRASLLPGTDKPALLWTIDLDRAGVPTANKFRRAFVRVDEAITYTEAQRRIDDGEDERAQLLAEIGRLRQQREVLRGGVSLNLPAQEIIEVDGTFSLAFDQTLPVENWNAQISLLTGIVAGRTMLDAGVGVLRTLPPPEADTLDRLRRVAAVLGLNWAADQSYPEFVRSITPTTPAHNAFLLQAARGFRGAGYVGFNGQRPEYFAHSAIASAYAHVTAPLRRLVDRFGNEILLSLHRGEHPPGWVLEALDDLPSLMGRARQRESSLERSMLDMTEALLLERYVGAEFDATVVSLNHRRKQAVVQVAEPAIVDTVDLADRTLGEQIRVRVDRADPSKRRVDLRTVAADIGSPS